jgi:hypothetical protein
MKSFGQQELEHQVLLVEGRGTIRFGDDVEENRAHPARAA